MRLEERTSEERLVSDTHLIRCSTIPLTLGYGLCHGTAGNGYAFLRLYQLTGDPKQVYRAVKFGEWCAQYGSHGCRTPDTPFSLFEGMAGTVYYMSDLLDPTRSRFPAYQLS